MPHSTHCAALSVTASSTKHLKQFVSLTQPVEPDRPGALSPLLDQVPLEIFHMVCGFMHPRDLLALSHTDKALRKMIWHKSFKRAWESSITTVEQTDYYFFPPTAPHLSLAAYVLLTFGWWCNHCHNEGHVMVVQWALGVRLCARCTNEQIISVFAVMPHTTVTGAERTALEKLLYQNHSTSTYGYCVYRPDAERDAQLWLSLDAEGRAKFEEEREEQADARQEHALDCEAWMAYCKSKRRERLNELCAARLSQIHELLCDLGWEEELKREWLTIDNHALVRKDELLTEQDWEDMAPELIRILRNSRNVQAMRLAVEDFLEKRCFPLVSWTEARPTRQDIECNDLFADFQPLFDPSLDPAERLRLEDIALRTFPSSVDLWRNSCAMDIIDICERPPGMDWSRPEDRPTTEEEKMAVFDLATNVFFCRRCGDFGLGKHARYPYILAHEHFRNGKGKWSSNRLRFATRGRDIVAELVRASGLDPETATCKDMDIRDARIVCADCYAVAPRKASAMTWWRCLDHIERQHTGFVPVKGWFALDPDSEQRVRQLSPRETVAGCSGWDCRVCGCLLTDWNAVKSHFAEQHSSGDGSEISVGSDVIFIDPYLQVSEPRSVWLCILDGDTDALARWQRRALRHQKGSSSQ